MAEGDGEEDTACLVVEKKKEMLLKCFCEGEVGRGARRKQDTRWRSKAQRDVYVRGPPLSHKNFFSTSVFFLCVFREREGNYQNHMRRRLKE